MAINRRQPLEYLCIRLTLVAPPWWHWLMTWPDMAGFLGHDTDISESLIVVLCSQQYSGIFCLVMKERARAAT
jgi:hypothetical protein